MKKRIKEFLCGAYSSDWFDVLVNTIGWLATLALIALFLQCCSATPTPRVAERAETVVSEYLAFDLCKVPAYGEDARLVACQLDFLVPQTPLVVCIEVVGSKRENYLLSAALNQCMYPETWYVMGIKTDETGVM